jgi:hypothetical protein
LEGSSVYQDPPEACVRMNSSAPGTGVTLQLSTRKPAGVVVHQESGVWFKPGLLLEILSAELTLSASEGEQAH